MARRTRGGGPATPALAVLAAAGVAHTVRAYDHDTTAHSRGLAYGLEAAQALGVPAEQVFKTLLAEVDGRLTVAIVPVTVQLDLKALAAAIGGKRAVMADPALAERTTGYVVGGISPLGQRKRLPTVLDASASEHAAILVSAGRRGLDVEVSAADLAALTGAVLAPISTG
ncbi:MAG: Cys-tRNA(Pro) deacylase [Kineosporiaceae bacterium]